MIYSITQKALEAKRCSCQLQDWLQCSETRHAYSVADITQQSNKGWYGALYHVRPFLPCYKWTICEIEIAGRSNSIYCPDPLLNNFFTLLDILTQQT